MIWARGSVVERTVHIRKVIGSIPIGPTDHKYEIR